MATTQQTSTVVPTQTRSVRAAPVWPPPSSGLMYTRPWRSSPLAGPAFSTLPPIIPESSEEDELPGPDSARELPRTRSPSIASQTGSLSASVSGLGSRNASGSGSKLILVEGDASTSSVSLAASTGAHGTSSSQGHGSSQSHSSRPATKSWGRRTSRAKDDVALPENASDVFIVHPPPARALSHGRSRSVSHHVQPLAPSPTIPQTHSRASPRPRTSPESGSNTTKQPPSVSRDPTSNWMSSSPFGPAQTPKFSRLAMASPTVVMPLSAKEYRKQKAKGPLGKGTENESLVSSNRITFIDNALSAFQNPNNVPVVKVSPPPSENVHRAPSSSDDHSPDRRSQPQSQVGHPPSKHSSQPSMSPRPSSPKHKRPRSRPNTPPRSSPLAAHPPISPKSSTGTFFSFASTEDDDSFRSQSANSPSSVATPGDDPDATNTVSAVRPRPRRRRRKSYPDRLSNGARLSLLEAMNRLSHESASLHRLSSLSQTDAVNRLSVVSQTSGHTLFYDVGESEGEQGQVTSGHGKGNGNADERDQCTPVLHTQSLEDLSSTLTRTGIEVVRADCDGDLVLSDGEHKSKRNVRVVRISDTVEVSPPPVHRRRKLTKTRPGLARVSAPIVGAGPVLGTGMVKGTKVETQTQTSTQERRASLLPWKSKGSGESKAGVSSTGPGPAANERVLSTPTKGPVHPNITPVSYPHPPVAIGSIHVESPSKPKSNSPSKKSSSDAPTSTPMTALSPDPGSSPSTPRKSRRYTFSFLPSSVLHRPKHVKSNTDPPVANLSLDHNTKEGVIGVEKNGTDSTSTSIRTITQGSQSTLIPTYDLTTLASSGGLSGSRRGTKIPVPMLRRLNAQEMATTGVPSQGKWDSKGGSTPSLITNGSTATTSSSPHTPSFYRVGGGEPFVPRPSVLKESYVDTSEEDSEGVSGGTQTSRMCVHQKQEPSPLTCAAVGWGETSEEDERYLCPRANTRPGSRPGTSDSTLTTATETSGSYLSFSTVPASTTSSSSTSRSESPSPVGDKQDLMVPVLQSGDGGEAVHTCALCGCRSPSPTRSLSPSRDPDLEVMHPMFTVPLITVPVSALDGHSRSRSNTPSAMQGGRGVGTGNARYAGGQKSERHASVPVSAVTANVDISPARPNQTPKLIPVNVNGGHVTMLTKARTTAMNDKMATTPTMFTMAPSPSPSPPKVKKRHRPQTAPAGTGDAALKFIEDAKAMRAREGGVDFDALIGSDRATKHSAGKRESKFRAVLKGLLRWGA